MSSFLGARGACGFNFDLIKKPSSSSSSNCSSTLSKSSSVSSLSISTKRARTPRKRPNQSYMEAATLLSTACPSVFSAKSLHIKPSTSSLSSLSSSSTLSSSEILTAWNDSGCLIETPSHDSKPSYRCKFKPAGQFGESSVVALRHNSPPKALDYDIDSIFDDDDREGIDSIMGKLSVNDCDMKSTFNPFVGRNIRGALRGVRICDLWSPMMVQMDDIVPMFSGAVPLVEKKKKVEEEVKNEYGIMQTSGPKGKIKAGLGLKLIHEEVIKAWGGRRFPFSCDSSIQEPFAEIAARLAEIDLSPEEKIEAGGMIQESDHNKQEKRKAQHFAKKNCYQVRKVSADCRPRIKGRSVKKTRKIEEICH